jgi:GGDEF domain-containing protein
MKHKVSPRWEGLFVEDYIRQSDFEREGLSRLDLSIIRSERVSEVNPLTKLPGNTSINRQIQTGIDGGEVFALTYADLDHFKPFNDYYGFTRGDDFVFIMDVSLVEGTAKEIIETFDRIIPTLYEAEDRERGYIETQDRQGNSRRFPLVALSIGITSNKQKSFTRYAEVTGIASEMKGQAKHVRGSCYRIDTRWPVLS